MLTPAQIQALAEPLESVYINIVNDLLINIGKHIRSGTATHTADWEIRKLSELGQLTQENAAIINRWIKSVPKELRDTMEDTRRAALDRLEKQMESALKGGYVTPPLADSTIAVFEQFEQSAAGTLDLVNQRVLNSSINQFVRGVQITTQQIEAAQGFLNDAAASVAEGTATRENAIRRALRQIADEGLTGFVDSAGRTWSPEAYVNMVVRTTVHNAAVDATKARMEDYGVDVFQVSSHAGARPLCYPYQGRFFSWNDDEGEVELGDGRRVHYDPLRSTSYGEPAGLFGINCGHYPIVIIPGYTIPHGADDIQPKEQNDKAYAESQQQRALERAIREAKRDVEMAGDLATDAMRGRIERYQADMREFIRETGRTRRYDREQI